MKWIKVAEEAIPGTDGVRKVKIAGKRVCIVRNAGQLHATSARCPHASADLSDDWCE